MASKSWGLLWVRLSISAFSEPPSSNHAVLAQTDSTGVFQQLDRKNMGARRQANTWPDIAEEVNT